MKTDNPIRLNTINFENKLIDVDYQLPKTKFGPYIVDDSNFIPMSEAVKQLTSNVVSDSVNQQYYDFPDGKDTGISIPATRTKNCKDIAELSQQIMDSVEKTSQHLADIRAEQAAKKAFQKSVSDLKSSSTDSSSGE